MQLHFMTDDLPKEITDVESVAIDTETMGLLPLRDRLCLVQVATVHEDIYLVHFPQGSSFAAPNLRKLLRNEKILKIFHYGRFDLAVLAYTFGYMCQSVYCTKIASKLCRTNSSRHSLKDLCGILLNLEIAKNQQTSDWGQDHLTEEQKEYAGQDVLYLHRLKEKLDALLKREKRFDLAQNCFKALPTIATLDLAGWDPMTLYSHHS